MAGYIKRDTAIRAVMAAKWVDGSDGAMAMEIVASPPAADVAPVVHGKWEVIHVKNHWDKARCSACKRVFESYEWGSNYCAVCGAKMDGGAE